MAELLGVSARTYTYWEYGQREVSTHALGLLVAEGWNANWVVTGKGPERLDELLSNGNRIGEAPGRYLSQDLSEDHLIIAIELADEAVRAAAGDHRPPRLLYGRLLRLIYQGVTQGLPMAEVRSIAREAADAFIGTGGSHDSKQGVDRSGPRRAGGDRGDQ